MGSKVKLGSLEVNMYTPHMSLWSVVFLTKYDIKLDGFEHNTPSNWSSYEFFKKLCESRSDEHNFLKTHSETNYLEYCEKKIHPILSLFCFQNLVLHDYTHFILRM